MKRFDRIVNHFGAMCLLAIGLLSATFSYAAAQDGDDEVTPQVQQLYAQAKVAQQRGDEAVAIEKYRAMVKLAPHLAAAYNNLGMLYFNKHDYKHASETLEHGLKLNANMPTASAMLGMSYAQLGESEKAEPLIRKALEVNPNDDATEMMLARILIKENQYDEASQRLDHFLNRNPNNQDAWYMLGKVYLQMSQNALKKINEIDPNSVVAHEISGEIDESMHNYDGALVEYKKAIEMAPRQAGTHMHMGNAYWLTGKWASAETEFKAELLNDPQNCTAHWKIANSMLEANESNDDAWSEVNQAIAQCPALMQARVDRARTLIRLGKHAEALPDLLMAEQDSPGEPSIHFLLAAVYRSQGKTSEAQQQIQTYSRLQREATDAVASQASGASEIKKEAH